MQQHYLEIIKMLGEDPEREGLRKTPQRAAEALRFLTRGYQQAIDPLLEDACFASDSSAMVVLRDIEMYSLCEHHLLPFFGHVHIAYLPNGKVMGISKLARIVDYYAQRLQLQERLTQQIAQCIQTVTQARGVAVQLEAKHLCMMARGEQKQNTSMQTLVTLGALESDPQAREAFFQLFKR